MKRLLLICLLSIINFWLRSEKLDSLIEVNNKYHKIDTTKLNILIQLAETYLNYDTQKAREITEQLMKYSKEINYPFGLAKANHIYGKILYLNLDNFNAIKYWELAASYFENTKNYYYAGNSFFNIAIVYNNLADNIKSFEYLSKAKYNFEMVKSLDGLASVDEAMGKILLTQGLYDDAIEKFNKALKYRIKNSDEKSLAYLYLYLGESYGYKNEPDKAIDYYMKAINKFEKIKYKQGIVSVLLNLSDVYNDKINNLEKAKVFIVKAYQIALEIKDTGYIIPATINMAIYYEKNKDYKKALELYNLALLLSEKIHSVDYIFSSLLNLGNYYEQIKDYNKSIYYLNKALDLSASQNDSEKTFKALLSIIDLYLNNNDYFNAEKHINQIDSLSKIINTHEVFKNLYEIKYELSVKKKDYVSALKFLELSYLYKDSIYKSYYQKQVILSELNYEYKQRENEMKVKYENEKIINIEKNKKQKLVIIFISIGLTVSLILGFIIFKFLRKSQSQNLIISNQNIQLQLKNDLIEEKNKQLLTKNIEITDSINYAKRIQNTILPNMNEWFSALPNSFVLYLPKDIVSGDFFWFKKSPFDENEIYIGVADCTGHGVPGALVSVICYNAITNSLLEGKKINTNEILNLTRSVVINQLSAQNQEIKDGMDIAVIKLNISEKKLQYSGANRPVYIIRNNEIIELLPDKHPIGVSDNFIGFKVLEFDLLENDFVFLLSDGCADQFGGIKNKKIGTKNFKEIIKKMCQLPIHNQKEFLNDFLIQWKGNNEQTDDITAVCIQIT